MSPPRLLYHAPALIPYPTNTDSSVCCIRFAQPVRISSIRITPEGVETLDNNAGVTFPPRWTGQVFFNTSDSDPVNALPACEIQVTGGEYDEDFAVDMPEDVTTRMLILRAPIERITLSIYGYTPNELPPASLPPPNSIHVAKSLPGGGPEDWSWLYTWTGGVHQLLNLLDDDTPRPTLSRALSSIDLLSEIRRSTLDEILDHSSALPFLLSLPSYPLSPILAQLYADPSYSLHPSLRHHLPPSHPLRPLVTSDNPRRAAWDRLDLGRGALMIIAESPGDDLLEVPLGQDRSNFSRLLDLAAGTVTKNDEEGKMTLEVILDIILGAWPKLDAVVVRYLIDVLPRLFVVSGIGGMQRELPFENEHARGVSQSLLRISTEVIHGQSTFETCRRLADPYLALLDPADLIKQCFTNNSTPEPPALADTTDGRRLSRLTSALNEKEPSSVQHTISPEELISLIAPSLLVRLQSAPMPPLGITSILSNPTPESHASNWAGKVYSEHQFRSRDAAPGIGLGIAQGVGRGMSRPASRHVDEYARG